MLFPVHLAVRDGSLFCRSVERAYVDHRAPFFHTLVGRSTPYGHHLQVLRRHHERLVSRGIPLPQQLFEVPRQGFLAALVERLERLERRSVVVAEVLDESFRRRVPPGVALAPRFPPFEGCAYRYNLLLYR